MKIMMITNTYLPHIGGVARSVHAFSEEYLRCGHEVLVVCPEFPEPFSDDIPCVRVPAIQNFNASDFSVALPPPLEAITAIDKFKPQIIHSHHPFLLGNTALRLAARYEIPLVFTHHTMYEQYTHYVPGDSVELKKFVVELATGYGQLCDCVVAPSESIAELLKQRGIMTRIEVIPTGVDLELFASGQRAAARKLYDISDDSFVVGHVGRLAPEKNLKFLARSVADFLVRNKNAVFLVVGEGPSQSQIQEIFSSKGLLNRLRLVGSRKKQELVDAYKAMDLFAFTSKTETQGMVLTEALASGLPIVALDAPGVREVVRSGVNGELLFHEEQSTFVTALEKFIHCGHNIRKLLQRGIEETAQQFSMKSSAQKALALYTELLKGTPISKNIEDSLWWMSLRQIETEWEILKNQATSLASAVESQFLPPFYFPWFVKIRLFVRRSLDAISRSALLIRMLNLARPREHHNDPGLVIVQIDGLSQTEFESALKAKRMPFLRQLMNRESYQLHTLYSGVPSTTPAVQGEFFYGKRSAVPAFEFYLRSKGQVARMFDSEPVQMIERELATKGEGLLQNGTSYSNIYTGGADEAHFCAATFGLADLAYSPNPFLMIFVVLSHIYSFARIVALLMLELVLTLVDFAVGTDRIHFWKELKFIPTRVGICILLRELITIGTCVDIFRGKPIIHLNFLGYDEQAHRRGPSSRYAHWTLKGIDASIKRIWKAALRSPARHYEVWIYSDHGQETTLPYSSVTGQTITAAVSSCFEGIDAKLKQSQHLSTIQLKRARWLGGKFLQRMLGVESVTSLIDESGIVVTDLGPLAHIYLPQNFTEEAQIQACKTLACKGKVPLVLRKVGNAVQAYKDSSEFMLPADASKILGTHHPFLREACDDLLELCRHELAGDIVLSGWRTNAPALSFALERGAHAGPGPNETRAFCLLPNNTMLPASNRNFLTFQELRLAALHALKRDAILRGDSIWSKQKEPGCIRVMTYNVHSCVGMDGRLSPVRIAKVIGAWSPDIVALQELDVRRSRSRYIHQVERIAHELKMHFAFQPALKDRDELYGDAILSRWPMRIVRADSLPTIRYVRQLEPRGALWVEIEIDGEKLQVITTHLGLKFGERKAQIEALLGPKWLGSPSCTGSVIFCGDFNALPSSYVYKKTVERFNDAQEEVKLHRPRGTYLSYLQFGRIDHVFLSRDLDARLVQVPATTLTRLASDHLPVIVDVALPQLTCEASKSNSATASETIKVVCH